MKKTKSNRLIKLLISFVVIIAPWVIAILIINYNRHHQLVYENKVELSCEHQPPVYHTKLQELQREFDSPEEVTETCLSCHTERGKEVMANAHWTWGRETYLPDRDTVLYLGKRNLLNNCCIGIRSNETTCSRCHVGYGWKDKNFDLSDQRKIDCLVCHDRTGTYKKAKGNAGYPLSGENAPDYTTIAQNVCIPTRENCGVCHFFGGGGNNVKHGDLEKALLECTPEVDVHMASVGENAQDMQCTECHVTENHNITGHSYSVSTTDENRVTCEQCHTDRVHTNEILDKHNKKVACQTCHIPVYAKVNATKMTWDWSTAGKLDDYGKPYHIDDENGNHTYLSLKGTFTWGTNVEPEYRWFNGTVGHHLLEDKIDTIPVQINKIKGCYKDSAAKIYPMKIIRSKQLYDPVNNTLIQPKLFAKKKGEGAFWKDFDFNASAKAGMEYVGLPYSGEYDFIKSEMYWPINHMVSPAEHALTCKECHSRQGRLSNDALCDFYMPGRDYNAALDWVGIILIILTTLGVMVHGGLRAFYLKKNK